MGPRVRVIDGRTAGKRHPLALRAVVVGSVLAVLAGCGLRVGSAEVKAANAAATATGGGGTGGGGAQQGGGGTGTGVAPGVSTAPGGPVVTSGNQATGPGVSTAPDQGSGVTVPGGGGGGSTGTGVAPPAPAGGNGGATDVGVSANSIVVGNVSDLGGPVPGLFQGGPYGTQAYFNYINSLGGVYGRKLVLQTRDSQLDCSQNEAQTSDLANKVFAFVGGWSLDDNCGAQILAKSTAPVLNQALSPQAEALPTAYNIQPFGAGAPLGPYLYYKSKFPDAITKVGTIVGNQGSAVLAWKYQAQTMESVGYKIIYEDDFNPASTNFTADVVRMKNMGVKMVIIQSVNAPDLAIFSQEAAQQGFKPEVFSAPIGYFGDYINQSGGAANVEGQYMNVGVARFLGEDAATVPEVALFDQWVKSSFPSFPIDQFAASSWANAALFVNALDRVGPHLTRAALIDALKNTHTFNDNGFEAPVDVGSKNPTSCYAILQIHNGKYERVDDPPTGFRCDGGYFHYKG